DQACTDSSQDGGARPIAPFYGRQPSARPVSLPLDDWTCVATSQFAGCPSAAGSTSLSSRRAGTNSCRVSLSPCRTLLIGDGEYTMATAIDDIKRRHQLATG